MIIIITRLGVAGESVGNGRYLDWAAYISVKDSPHLKRGKPHPFDPIRLFTKKLLIIMIFIHKVLIKQLINLLCFEVLIQLIIQAVFRWLFRNIFYLYNRNLANTLKQLIKLSAYCVFIWHKHIQTLSTYWCFDTTIS